jgi:hypothetical protein
LLATGQYYNVEGIHPSGTSYYWRGEHPTVSGPYDLTMIGEEEVNAFYTAPVPLLDGFNCQIEKHAIDTAKSIAHGDRKTGGDPAPTKEAALSCLRNIKNVEGSRFDSRAKFVGLIAGIEVMCAPFADDEEVEEAKWDVYLMYPGNDEEYVQHIIDSNLNGDKGYTFVMEITGQGLELAQQEFADASDDDDTGDMPPDPIRVAKERMFSENIYIADLDHFLHLPTMVLRKPKAFSTAYTDSGKYGGRKTAEMVFLNNNARGRRYGSATYPGS